MYIYMYIYIMYIYIYLYICVMCIYIYVSINDRCFGSIAWGTIPYYNPLEVSVACNLGVSQVCNIPQLRLQYPFALELTVMDMEKIRKMSLVLG